MTPLPVRRTQARLAPNPARVIVRTFNPANPAKPEGKARIERVLGRILGMAEADVAAALATVNQRFADRHRDLRSEFERNFANVAQHVERAGDLSRERRELIGAYFTHEYAIEGAALSNPSIVPAPDQTGLSPGETRFVLSLRAIGEGHISSIEFRSGVVDASGNVAIEPASRFVGTARRESPIYDKALFQKKLEEMRAYSDGAAAVLGALPDRFTMGELEAAIRREDAAGQTNADGARVTRALHWLASSNYESHFRPESDLSARVLFPAGPAESSGMEDARFVRFTHEDGNVTYFATYTAYDGYQILPQLIETEDFVAFRIATLNGACAKNKGLALFPRKIGGRYVALGRLDNENNFLLRADDVRFWHESTLLQTPRLPWEFIQIGNCGSPIETEMGWLVITHGVGAMRQYSLGAILLDRDDPARVIAHLTEPLLEASEEERDGYVPNVVYSCGSMLAGDHLVLPYGISDAAMGIATVRLSDLLARLTHRNAARAAQ
jgi:predicted GH43/DUF377 family glycosyl hydrolase